MKLTSPSQIKAIMDSHGIRFNKGYGQNFLISEEVPYKIARECGADRSCGVIEVGPGIGTLTSELAEVAKKVVAVEIDTNLIGVLAETLSGFENVRVINSDILKIDLKKLVEEEFGSDEVCVCANLPYYITTPILMYFIESGLKFKSITVMVQKEVALRLSSKPGDSDYGAITAAIARYGTARRLFNVPSGCFMPAPKVDSAVLQIIPHEVKPYEVKSEEMLTKVIRAAFAQRRKTLLNSLSGSFPKTDKQDLKNIIISCGFSETVRGEQLGIPEFAKIADMLYELSSKNQTV